MDPFAIRRWIRRCPVEVRDGKLFAAGVPLRVAVVERHAYEGRASTGRVEIGARLTEASFDAVEDALNAQAVAHGVDQPVGLTLQVRLRQCASCGAPFLGEWTSRLCSTECCLNSLAKAESKQRAKRTQARAEARAERTCRRCGESDERRAVDAGVLLACVPTSLLPGAALMREERL
jgi:hypothetical protein